MREELPSKIVERTPRSACSPFAAALVPASWLLAAAPVVLAAIVIVVSIGRVRLDES
jgi:hypothetical protein